MSKLAATTARYDRTGLLAVDPKAFFELFAVPESRCVERVGSIDVIEVSGPLTQRDQIWCDSYESIRARFGAALASDSRAIVFRFDSPGGDTAGCFETARAIRAEALRARKPVYAYVDKACSAAYALASAATHGIAIGETCPAGSIGVVSARTDVSAANAQRGLRMAFVVSGQRKLDGNPDVSITDAELIETQRHVDDLAGRFFGLVSDMRSQLSAASVAGFDGGIFYGGAAVDAGLVDGVCTFEDLLLAAASAGGNMSLSLFSKTSSDYDSARASLAKAAKGTDANAAAARRALAAMAAAEGDESEPDDPEKPAPGAEGEPDETKSEGDDPDETKSEGEPDEAKSDGEPDETKSAGSTMDEAPADKKPKAAAQSATQSAGASPELSLAAKVHRLEAKLAARDDAAERKRLLATRPDFGAEMKSALAKAPLETVREMCRTLPRGKVQSATSAPARNPVTTVSAARGVSQVSAEAGQRTRLSGEVADQMDRAMGFTSTKLGSVRDGTAMRFGLVEVSQDDPPAKAG